MSLQVALAALLIGVVVGYFVQHVTSSLKYNGQWPALPAWKKRSLAATGAIAAFASGVYVLQGLTPADSDTVVFRLWLWQTMAAWGGASALDWLWDRVRKGAS